MNTLQTEVTRLLISNERRHLRKHIRKAGWLIDQIKLAVERSPAQLDPDGHFAKNLADVQRHFTATCQRFF